MNIPEELNRLSNKELKEVLTDNILKCKYLYYNNDITTIKEKTKSGWVIETEGNNYILKFKSIKRNYTPLTLDHLKNIKVKESYSRVTKLSLELKLKFITKLFLNFVKPEWLDVILDKEGYIDVIVYYPEITITNSVEQEHTMREVYIKYAFRSGDLSLYNLYIARTRYTREEFNNGYVFSHISGNLLGWGGRFCFGEYTTISKVVEEVKAGSLHKLTDLIVLMDEYLRWESLEGVPYAYIGKLSDWKSSYVKSNLEFPGYIIVEAYDILIKHLDSIDFNYDLLTGIFRARIDSSTLDIISGILTDNGDPSWKYSYYDYSSYRLRDEDVFTEPTEYSSEVVFKGVEQTTVVDSPARVVLPVKAHVNLVAAVAIMLEEKLNEFLEEEKVKEQL